ncbi:MAG: hypothetical protein ACI80K_004763 [Paracoccaceae bacterium]|jgi:hypothetical protein
MARIMGRCGNERPLSFTRNLEELGVSQDSEPSGTEAYRSRGTRDTSPGHRCSAKRKRRESSAPGQ